MTTANDALRLAVPKGRILEELLPLLARVGIEPEASFSDKHERKLEFATNVPNLSILRVRSFDIATFVAFGAAQMGVAGRDVLMEFDYPEVYAPLDLGIGYCRMVVAEKEDLREQDNPRRAFQARFEEALRRWQRNEDDYQETWPAFRERVLASLYSLANRLESGDSALVFTSGGAISVAIQHLLELDQEALITFNRGLINTSVTRLLVNTGRLRLATLNEHLHLAGDMLTYR